MRIVLIRSNPVSPDSRVEKEAHALIKQGHTVHILAWDREPTDEGKNGKGTNGKGITSNLPVFDLSCQITRFGIQATFGGGMKQNAKPLLLFQRAIKRWLTSHHTDYDVIHACDFDTAYTASKVARRYNKLFVYDIFDYYVDAFSVPGVLKRVIEKMDQRIINRADQTIICTEKRRQQIAQSKPKQLTVIHNTPPSQVFKEADTRFQGRCSSKDTLAIAYVGILQDGRMIKELIECVSEDPELELHIGGFGKLEPYIREKSNDCSSIHFYGKLPYEQTLQLEHTCDVMTALYDPSVPNHAYAAPNKFYEGLMLGKPLIMAHHTGMDHIISSERFGKVIAFDKASLKGALNELKSEKSSFTDISQRMKSVYDQHYSWSEMERRLAHLYKKMEEDYEKDNGNLWDKTGSDKNVPVDKRPVFERKL